MTRAECENKIMEKLHEIKDTMDEYRDDIPQLSLTYIREDGFFAFYALEKDENGEYTNNYFLEKHVFEEGESA